MIKDSEKWIRKLENVNEVRLSGICGEIAYQQQILSCHLQCEHFAVLLLVRGAPREIRDKVFRLVSRSSHWRLGHDIDFFIDVFVAEALPVRDPS